MNAVRLEHISKRFGDVLAVDDVSLEIRHGEFFSLLGPSGCGKTTSLRIVAGFELPGEGEVYIKGELMGRTPPFQRNVNMVFQNYALFPHMDVFSNVAFGLEMKRIPRTEITERVKRTLEMVRLPGYEQRHPSQLSGGQQQRVALARALVNEPEVLLLDEPLGALDLKLRKAMQLELKGLQERLGITFVYVTHDQEEALTMSDRIAVMDQGRVLQVGEPQEIYERPASRFVADFIGVSNFLPGRVLELNGHSARVRLNAGPEVVGVAGQGLSAGQEVTVAVRPERIIMHSPPVEEINLLDGRVQGVVYIGTDTQYIVTLGDGTQVTVRHQNTSAPVQHLRSEVGHEVVLAWKAESALVLAE